MSCSDRPPTSLLAALLLGGACSAPLQEARPQRPASAGWSLGEVERMMARQGLEHAYAVSGSGSPPRESYHRLEEERQREERQRAALPALSRDEVLGAMGPVLPLARRCYESQGLGGVVVTKLFVDIHGRVTHVVAVRGAEFADARTTDCLRSALRQARFPPSRGLIFEWPFTP